MTKKNANISSKKDIKGNDEPINENITNNKDDDDNTNTNNNNNELTKENLTGIPTVLKYGILGNTITTKLLLYIIIIIIIIIIIRFNMFISILNKIICCCSI